MNIMRQTISVLILQHESLVRNVYNSVRQALEKGVLRCRILLLLLLSETQLSPFDNIRVGQERGLWTSMAC